MLAATWNATLFDVLSNFLFLIAFIVPAIRNMWILDQFYDVERVRVVIDFFFLNLLSSQPFSLSIWGAGSLELSQFCQICQ
jgi:hypothetical protein